MQPAAHPRTMHSMQCTIHSLPTELLVWVVNALICAIDCYNFALSSKVFYRAICKMPGYVLQADMRNAWWVAAMEHAMFSNPFDINPHGECLQHRTIKSHVNMLWRIRQYTADKLAGNFNGMITDAILQDFMLHSPRLHRRTPSSQWYRQVLRACTMAMERCGDGLVGRNNSLVYILPAYFTPILNSILKSNHARREVRALTVFLTRQYTQSACISQLLHCIRLSL